VRLNLRIFDSTVARRIFISFFFASLLPVALVAVLLAMQVRDTVEQQALWRLRDAGRDSGEHLLAVHCVDRRVPVRAPYRIALIVTEVVVFFPFSVTMKPVSGCRRRVVAVALAIV
jgi:hypothetical protein